MYKYKLLLKFTKMGSVDNRVNPVNSELSQYQIICGLLNIDFSSGLL